MEHIHLCKVGQENIPLMLSNSCTPDRSNPTYSKLWVIENYFFFCFYPALKFLRKPLFFYMERWDIRWLGFIWRTSPFLYNKLKEKELKRQFVLSCVLNEKKKKIPSKAWVISKHLLVFSFKLDCPWSCWISTLFFILCFAHRYVPSW